MSLTPTTLDAGEAYATVDDVLNASDLPEATIRVPQWKRNGTPLAIRVRALSLAQREAIQRESKQGADVMAQLEATLREGCVMPKFDVLQAARLRHKNGHALEQVAAFIWALSTIDQELIDATVQALSGAAAAPADDPQHSGDRERA